MKLRPYQAQCVEAVLSGFQQYNKQLVVIPTGGGKTIVFSGIAARLQPKRTLILAHREELIDQAIAKLASATGIRAGREKAESRASKSDPVVVASVQSMIRRLDEWPADHFGLVVADEAHHAISASWQKVLNHFDQAAWVLGVTATPDRSDKRNLGGYFEAIPFELGLFDLVNQGFLSGISVKSIPIEIDITGVRQTAGDYNEADLGQALEPYLRQIAKAIATECAFRRTLVFLPLIATSETFRDICREEGLVAEHVCGVSPDRAEQLAKFAAGDTEVLCNAMLLTEGFDDPGIDCVVVLRPTKSRALYSQMVGRGTRVAPGKGNLLLLDFLWMHEAHNLVRPAHLVAKSNDVAEEITELAEEKARGGVQGELDLQGLASETQIKREAKLAEEIAKNAKKKARVMDANEFALFVHSDAAEYEPTMKWEGEAISEGQAKVLSRFGIDLDTITCKGHASRMIDLLVNRSRMGLASPKQMRLLRQLRHPHPETATFEQASLFLNRRFHANA